MNHDNPKPTPTPLNFNPLLRTMFDMAGIPAKAADAYEAHVVQEQERAYPNDNP